MSVLAQQQFRPFHSERRPQPPDSSAMNTVSLRIPRVAQLVCGIVAVAVHAAP